VSQKKPSKSFDQLVAHIPLDALADVSPDATINSATLTATALPSRESSTDPIAPASDVDICSIFWPESDPSETESIASLLSLVVIEGESDSHPGIDLQLGETLGKGGMGEVKLGHQTCLKRPVAIKMPHPHERRLGGDAALAARPWRRPGV